MLTDEELAKAKQKYSLDGYQRRHPLTASSISLSDLETKCRAFEKWEPRDSMYRVSTFLVREWWGDPAKLVDANRMAYVSVSRGQYDAQIFTNDRGMLGEVLGHDVSHKSAYQPKQAIAPLVPEIAETHTPKRDFGQGIGMGLGM